MPAVGAEARRSVVTEPAVHRAVDADAVVVVERDQLVQAQRAGQRTGFVADAFHQAAVAQEDIAVVVDHPTVGPVELVGQQLLGQGHANRIAQALAQGAGGGLDAGREVHLGVAWGLAVQLAELLQLSQRQGIAGQVQQGIQQHRGMAVAQHEAVAVAPLRVNGVVAQVLAPQGHSHLGHAHRRARVARVGLLHAVHGQGAQGVGAQVGVDGAAAQHAVGGVRCHGRGLRVRPAHCGGVPACAR